MNPVVNDIFYHRSLGRESAISLPSLHSAVEFRLIFQIEGDIMYMGMPIYSRSYNFCQCVSTSQNLTTG